MIDFGKLKIGDRIVRTKGGIFTKHHIVYAGFWYGQHLGAENQRGHGVRYVNLLECLRGGTVERVEYNNFHPSVQDQIIDRINRKLGTAYDLIDYNCEHFANEVINGIRKSNQVTNAVAATLGVALLAAVFSRND